jgi:hypothetical protein
MIPDKIIHGKVSPSGLTITVNGKETDRCIGTIGELIGEYDKEKVRIRVEVER